MMTPLDTLIAAVATARQCGIEEARAELTEQIERVTGWKVDQEGLDREAAERAARCAVAMAHAADVRAVLPQLTGERLADGQRVVRAALALARSES